MVFPLPMKLGEDRFRWQFIAFTKSWRGLKICINPHQLFVTLARGSLTKSIRPQILGAEVSNIVCLTFNY